MTPTLVSKHVVASALNAGTLRALPLDVPPRAYHIVRHGKRPLSEAQKVLVDMMPTAT